MSRRRATALIATMFVVVIGSLAAAGALLAAGQARMETRSIADISAARAAARSGVRAVMAELGEQRIEIALGADPQVSGSHVLETSVAGRQLVWRLSGVDEGGSLVGCETAGINVLHADADMLAALCDVSVADADALVASLRSEPPGSVAEARDRLSLSDDRRITVFSADSDRCVGAFPNTEDRRDQARIVPGDSGESGAQTPMEQAVLAGASASLDSTTLVRRLIDRDISPQDWGEAFDAISVTGGAPRLGRLDLNRADAGTLALVPGINEEAADAIVDARERLDASTRRSIAWPVAEGLIEAADFTRAARWLTTSSWQWRVRVEAGFVPAPDRSGLDGIGGISDAQLQEEALADARLEYPITLECVIDLSVTPPRLAYLSQRLPGEVKGDATSDGMGDDSESPDVESMERGFEEPEAIDASSVSSASEPDGVSAPATDSGASPAIAPSSAVRVGRWLGAHTSSEPR
ncbi:MAG: hypothetical protein AAGK04_14325 [Planctomycetota bacterium]